MMDGLIPSYVLRTFLSILVYLCKAVLATHQIPTVLYGELLMV